MQYTNSYPMRSLSDGFDQLIPLCRFLSLRFNSPDELPPSTSFGQQTTASLTDNNWPSTMHLSVSPKLDAPAPSTLAQTPSVYSPLHIPMLRFGVASPRSSHPRIKRLWEPCPPPRFNCLFGYVVAWLDFPPYHVERVSSPMELSGFELLAMRRICLTCASNRTLPQASTLCGSTTIVPPGLM
jgi:hypothetical protein